MNLEINDIIRHKEKKSISGYSHDGTYTIVEKIRMKRPDNGKWIDAFIYQDNRSFRRFARDCEDVQKQFEKVQDGK